MNETQLSTDAFIVAEIKRARLAAGLTQEEFGKRANFSNSHVSAVEIGTRALRMDFIRGADRALNTGGLFERLAVRLRAVEASPAWFRDWMLAEAEAIALRSYENVVLPGLLQTEAYARAVFAAGGLLPPEEVERRVAARLERQALLTREKPPTFVAVVDEALLHRPVGGPEVMAEQLRHLVRLCTELPHVTLHVVPATVGAYAGLSGPFVVATLPGGEDVVYLDNQLRGQMVGDRAGLFWVRKAWDSILGEALSAQRSIELISEVAEKWESDS
ncbi:helix-turn-helix transcriptional regulator [Micromonospora sp. NPDC049559]|uniref:helix-turn-helix domain-containing protein n=1 Tax=Micromonospora sp. NPDC049559 TaxID=3155923 RepID=UPI00343CA3EB